MNTKIAMCSTWAATVSTLNTTLHQLLVNLGLFCSISPYTVNKWSIASPNLLYSSHHIGFLSASWTLRMVYVEFIVKLCVIVFHIRLSRHWDAPHWFGEVFQMFIIRLYVVSKHSYV